MPHNPDVFSVPLHAPAHKSAGLTRAFLRLKKMAQRRRHHLRLDTILSVLGQDGLLALNALLCLLNIILSPLHGISLPLGILQLLILTALLRGRKTFWIPRRWRSRPFLAATLIARLDTWLPRLYGMERISQPRVASLMRKKNIQHGTLWLLWLIALVIACPIPFLNITPALAGFFLSLGLINRDGLAWFAGIAVTLAHSGLYFFWDAFWPSAMALYHAWFG